MCGRFTLSAPGDVVAELFELADQPELCSRYNIAPTQPAPVVLWDRGRNERRFDLLRWGLIPSWADEPGIGNRMINTRAETVATKPAFRAAFRYRRCLIVADGFYEWQKLRRGRQPFYIHLHDKGPFAFAGLWEHWEGSDGSAVKSCTILTTEANDVVRAVHDRMPVILQRQDYARWLDPELQQADALIPLLRPYPADEMAAYRIGTRVNNPAHDGPECVEERQ